MLAVSDVIVQALNERAGCGLQLLGAIDQGQSGAAYVRWPDGRDAVVTTSFATIQEMRLTAGVLAEVRSLGIPVPEHQFLFDLEDGTVAVVQERMPGATVRKPDVRAVAAIVAMNERFAGLLRNRPDIRRPELLLGRPGEPIDVDAIEGHSARARRLVQRIRRFGEQEPEADIVGSDLVHVDLTVPNMLFDTAGQISGGIDWNYGIARGDRLFGVVKLLHTLSFDARTAPAELRPAPEAIDYLEQVLADRLDPTIFGRYWAHQSLNMLHSSHRWGTPHAFATYLSLGEAKLP